MSVIVKRRARELRVEWQSKCGQPYSPPGVYLFLPPPSLTRKLTQATQHEESRVHSSLIQLYRNLGTCEHEELDYSARKSRIMVFELSFSRLLIIV